MRVRAEIEIVDFSIISKPIILKLVFFEGSILKLVSS